MADTMQITWQIYSATPPLPRKVDAMFLGAAAEETYTVPAGTQYVILASDNPFYLRVDAAAAVPAAEITDGTGSMYIPSTGQFVVETGSVLHFIRATAVNTIITIARYGR